VTKTPGLNPLNNFNETTPATINDVVKSWVVHLSFQDDGISDPEAIQVRPVNDKDGCLYLDPEQKENTKYLLDFVSKLEALGYNDKNMKIFPYDWRISPYHLENRDLFFTLIQGTIEYVFQENGKPVALIGHSTGNRIIQFFLNSMKSKHGQDWIDKHIATYIALSAPFLGIPRTLRSLVSGDDLGLSNFLPLQLSVDLFRRWGSLPLYLPFGMKYIFGKAMCFMDNAPQTLTQFLDNGIGTRNMLNIYNDYYKSDSGNYRDYELEGDILGRPPVKKLLAIYGVNIPTESGYIFSSNNDNIQLNMESNNIPNQFQGCTLNKGIIFETRQSPQINGPRSGDGVVPYASLSQVLNWKGLIQDLKVFEMPNVDHNQIIIFDHVFEIIVDHLCSCK